MPAPPPAAPTTLASADASTAAAATMLSEAAPAPGRPGSPQSFPRVVLHDAPDLPADVPLGERYEPRDTLGAGGMGEVRRVFDRRIGRDVACKVMHGGADDARMRARFLREAQLQGQLEHPAIVPVYDLGVTERGEPWFTMKRVRGVSLEQVLSGLAHGNEAFAARYSRRRLLSAFSQVCLAIDYAHTRGVVHRDMKPANVMLGEFGEVHVIDWGVSKVGGEPAPDEPPSSLAAPPRPSTELPVTETGVIVGTAGYMSPEQARGEVDLVDARSDVYALGVILFEILTLQPMHVGSTGERLDSTLAGRGGRPSERAHDVPPELDTICAKATALEPAGRYPSARALSEAIERFLDGDRDMERRRQLAAEHLARAEQALAGGAAGAEAAAAPPASGDEPGMRSAAMFEVGRALAIDPSNGEALRLLGRLLEELPERLPAEAAEELRPAREARRREWLRDVALRYGTWIATIPILIASGLRSWTLASALIAAIVACEALVITMWWRRWLNNRAVLCLVAASAVMIGGMGLLFGPFVLLPTLAATNAIFLAMHTGPKLRRWVVGFNVLAIVVPTALAAARVLPMHRFDTGTLMIRSLVVHLSEGPTIAYLLLVHVALVVTPSILAGRMRDKLEKAEERVHLQAWNLRQLLPREAQARGSR